MIKNYDNNPYGSGIYVIFNNHNWRVYIGQTKRFKSRWRAHISSLFSGKNQNAYLQHDFNKCFKELGHDDFLEFHIIKSMPNSSKEERNVIEKYYIDIHWDKQEQCYNFRQDPGNIDRSCYSYSSEETSKLHSEARKGKYHNDETKKLMSVGQKESWTDERRKNHSINFTGEGNPFFGKHHSNESIKLISEAMSGEGNPFFGRTHSDETKKLMSDKKIGTNTGKDNPMYGIVGENNPFSKTYQIDLININTGEIIYGPIIGLSSLARKLNLHCSNLSNLVSGKIKTCKGWKLLTPPITKP